MTSSSQSLNRDCPEHTAARTFVRSCVDRKHVAIAVVVFVRMRAIESRRASPRDSWVPSGFHDTGHGARLDTVVHRVGDHEVHAGLPRAWLTPDIEVYHYARGPAQNLEVLSWGFDPLIPLPAPVMRP